jgi:hypothetical protein
MEVCSAEAHILAGWLIFLAMCLSVSLTLAARNAQLKAGGCNRKRRPWPTVCFTALNAEIKNKK